MESSPQRYHCLIGLPGSGKSTIAQTFLELQPETFYICPDRIRQQLYGDAIIQGDWLEIQAEIGRIFAIAQTSNRPVLYDATNAKPEWRQELLNHYSYQSAQWIGWIVDTPLATCLQRNQQRTRQVPEAVIMSYEEALRSHPPSIAEGFSQLITLSGQLTPRDLKQQLRQHLLC